MGQSSGVRCRAGPASNSPAAATAKAICIPAMEMGAKKAWAPSPAATSHVAIFLRSKSGRTYYSARG